MTPSRVRLYALVLLAFAVFILKLRITDFLSPFDIAAALPAPGDLPPHLAGARLLLDGAGPQLYDMERQKAAVQEVLGGRYPDYVEFYLSPAFVGLFYMPLARLPYQVAALVWTLSIALMSLAGVWLLRPFAPLRWSGLLYTASWPLVGLVMNSQDSAIALVILAAGLRLLVARCDGWAGLVLALGLFKPQLFLLVPIVLLCQRRDRALASFMGGSLFLGAVTIGLVGFDGVMAWFHLLTSPVLGEEVMNLSWNQMSLAAVARGVLGASPILPAIVGLLAIVPTVLFVRHAVRLPRNPAALIHLYSLAIILGLLVTPYSWVYDGVILAVPLAISWRVIAASKLGRWSLIAAYLLLWTSFPRHMIFPSAGPLAILGIALAPVALAGLAVALGQSLPLVGVKEEAPSLTSGARG